MGEPLPICYLNGEYLPLRDARISPLDRGFLYADGCYEVTPVFDGRPFRFQQHHDRLTRSLKEIRMADPLTHDQWRALYRELIARNRSNDGKPADLYIYVQVTRGAEFGRNHAPLPDVPRTVFAFAAPWPDGRQGWRENGLPAVTAEDTRWARCDIKSVSLLANVLLRQLAVDEGASECILLRDGQLTDSSASSVHVVIGGELRTPPYSWKLLPGTTRGVIEEVADKAGVKWRSVPVSEVELRGADEILLGAATREVQAVTSLDGRPVGTGKPGPVWRKLSDAFQAYKQEVAGTPW
jgi:D-alanine transaminase